MVWAIFWENFLQKHLVTLSIFSLLFSIFDDIFGTMPLILFSTHKQCNNNLITYIGMYLIALFPKTLSPGGIRTGVFYFLGGCDAGLPDGIFSTKNHNWVIF
jgi:hypothetical protein